ncbi:hypothetical protein EXIGLDRAFT_730606 [Exidia glandulosa HHB12029]|uniref:Uncharacterized protein n=1 Tax=Exidia glandulosa HHB12029 TaxID=1314781 RepID=A0A165C412_EXIGL|nr:hypothetical protein EXIGLDRAFT_730606 [Exidia glandulosa HHB12029]
MSLLTRRQKIIVGVGGVIVMPVAFAAGIYIGAVWDNYKAQSSNANENERSESELRKEERRLIEERAALERKIGAMEGHGVGTERRPGPGGS